MSADAGTDRQEHYDAVQRAFEEGRAVERERSSGRVETAVAQARADERARIQRNPCQCDPPGSGEDMCTEHCYVRLQAKIDAKKPGGWAFIEVTQARADERARIVARLRAMGEKAVESAGPPLSGFNETAFWCGSGMIEAADQLAAEAERT